MLYSNDVGQCEYWNDLKYYKEVVVCQNSEVTFEAKAILTKNILLSIY